MLNLWPHNIQNSRRRENYEKLNIDAIEPLKVVYLPIVAYLAIQNASQKWTMALHHWRAAMHRFAIEFEERFS